MKSNSLIKPFRPVLDRFSAETNRKWEKAIKTIGSSNTGELCLRGIFERFPKHRAPSSNAKKLRSNTSCVAFWMPSDPRSSTCVAFWSITNCETSITSSKAVLILLGTALNNIQERCCFHSCVVCFYMRTCRILCFLMCGKQQNPALSDT